MLNKAGVHISMDPAWAIPRHHLHRKTEATPEASFVYLEELTDGFKAQRIIREWMTFSDSDRPHPALAHQTPREAYWAGEDDKVRQNN